MDFTFTPENHQQEIAVPYFEDATAAFAPYYSANQRARSRGTDQGKVERLQSEIAVEMSKLGGLVIGIIPGMYGSGKARRHGYEIRFIYGGAQGIMRVAGLPIRSETPVRKQAVLVQALSIGRDWLKAAVTQKVFGPGSDVLIPFLLADGQRTIAEVIHESGKLPLLDSSD